MSMLSKAVRMAAVLTVAVSVGAAIAAETSTPAPETVGEPVRIRSWPMAGKWRTDLARTTYDGPVCQTFTVDQNKSFGLRAKDEPNSSLSFVIGGPDDEILSANTIKVWIDGFLLGEFPVTRRVQSSTGKAIHAAVPRAQASALLDLFGTGQWIAISTGLKTYSAPLEGSDSALKAFVSCTHEVAALNSLNATVDLSQVERRDWVEMCEHAVSAVAQFAGKADMAGSCPSFWDARTTNPHFSELDDSLKAVNNALVGISSLSALSDPDRLGPLLPFLTTVETLGTPLAPIEASHSDVTGPAGPSEALSQPMSPNGAATEANLKPLREMRPTHSAPAVDPSWQSAVANWLASRKTYPEEARQRGEEGRVAIRFTVDRSGRVLEAAIVNPSGSERLNDAALALFRQASLPAFPANMPQARTTITTTVNYSLR